MLNRKVYGTGEVFYRDREGIPATRLASLPSTFGAKLPQENLNSISDRGFEFSLGTTQKMGDFTFDVAGNISWSRAKYEFYDEPEYEDEDDFSTRSNIPKFVMKDSLLKDSKTLKRKLPLISIISGIISSIPNA